MKAFPLTLLLCLTTVFGLESIEVQNTARDEQEEKVQLDTSRVTLQNKWLTLWICPELNGGIENVLWKERNLPLLWGGGLQWQSYGPLFARPIATGVLFQEKFWGQAFAGQTPMVQQSCNAQELTLYSDTYESLPIKLIRRISLPSGELAIHFEVKIHGCSQQSLRNVKFLPWLNLLPSGDIDWNAVIPALGGDVVNGLGQKTALPATGIYRHGGSSPNAFFASARQWIAVSSPKEKLSMALVHDYDNAGCTMYSWQGKLEGKNARTIEFILPEFKAANGNAEFFCYRYRLLVFPGLGDLREICDDTGIEMQRDGQTLRLKFVATKRQAAAPITLEILQDKSKPISLGTRQLPELQPAVCQELFFELPADSVPTGIVGHWGTRRFELLNLVQGK